LGISWEKLFFSWDFRGTFSNGFQQVTRKVGNFVGITFFFVGITWEKVREKLGGSGEKDGFYKSNANRNTNKSNPNVNSFPKC
jgi:hypothetical protein